MAHVSATQTETPDGTADVPDTLRDLLALASWLAVRWNELDEQARAALLRRIQQGAAELGLPDQRQEEVLGSGDALRVHDRLFLLTPRELEVLRAMADGHSTVAMASLLAISTSTVRSHVKSLLAKLGLHSRVEAVCLVLGQGASDRGSRVS